MKEEQPPSEPCNYVEDLWKAAAFGVEVEDINLFSDDTFGVREINPKFRLQMPAETSGSGSGQVPSAEDLH
ncbi:hypothetical protein M0R45_012935 [Rubus argutus]|uniref:Uncharacterized protein n=1 Tax=Rubus argutus TaxID=59490 RepID=A0AAW1XH95_RUBAR